MLLIFCGNIAYTKIVLMYTFCRYIVMFKKNYDVVLWGVRVKIDLDIDFCKTLLINMRPRFV